MGSHNVLVISKSRGGRVGKTRGGSLNGDDSCVLRVRLLFDLAR
jgi:hypothetical protein